MLLLLKTFQSNKVHILKITPICQLDNFDVSFVKINIVHEHPFIKLVYFEEERHAEIVQIHFLLQILHFLYIVQSTISSFSQSLQNRALQHYY